MLQFCCQTSEKAPCDAAGISTLSVGYQQEVTVPSAQDLVCSPVTGCRGWDGCSSPGGSVLSVFCVFCAACISCPGFFQVCIHMW